MGEAEKFDRDYRIIVIELDDVVPRKDPSKPNLYVAKTVSVPEDRFESIKKSKKKHWYSDHCIRLRTDLVKSKPFMSREDAHTAYLKLVKKLNSEGYTVNRNNQFWSVYVVELDATAVTNPGKGYVYVGETSRTPEERFEQHRSGARNKHGRLYSNVVRKHGIKLRPDLAPNERFFDKESSKRGEKKHYEYLKSLGYNVKGGH